MIERIYKNISIDMMRSESTSKEWVKIRDLFYEKTSVPENERGLIKLNCFIEGYMACKEIMTKQTPYLGQIGTVSVTYNFNPPDNLQEVQCEIIAIYKDGRIVVQCYDIHGKKWESETFSRIEFFTPKK